MTRTSPFARTPTARAIAYPPEEVAFRLNRMMIEDVQVDQYFTLAYAEVDLFTGHVKLVQAGHPHPFLMRGTQMRAIGEGGMPIGLIPGATYEAVSTQLLPGDRLFLVSDGVTECPDPNGNELGSDGLQALLHRSAHLPTPQLLEALIWDLSAFSGGDDFPDDVSGIMLDCTGPA